MTLSAVRPRTWALGVVALAAMAGLCLVGAWQWRVAFPRDAGAPPVTAPVEVADLVPPGWPLRVSAVGREVTATGRYEPERTLRVTGRELAGRGGTWQLVPLRTQAGAVLPVVRAFVPAGAAEPAVPTGTVTVTGRVQPSFLAPAPATSASPGEVASVDTAELVNLWSPPIHPAYVVAQQETPPPVVEPQRVPPFPAVADSSSVQWRNLAYAVQWFVFAGFAALLWLRLARDDVASAQ